ncbi:flagellar basal-body rod protein FlgF [Paraferrimonas sp. SM1919]|uniref:flagellar basal-body rod protein FlgF n=1 Tax=Paraferrimonas sp. SM1919 TaxID=2662263 RepID=UPI0013D4F309|nr:flagellar basal-body rod protein FlgF [Paraferrimonas sp. SM1919]
MDEFLYIAMSGAKNSMQQLSVRANNLANASTDAFKAEITQARSMPAYGSGHPSRVFAMAENPSANFAPGAIKTTGRALDVAIDGNGFFAVNDANGNQAYSRNGAFRFDQNGMLLNGKGQAVLGDDDAPIFVPLPIQKVEISQDGIVSVRPRGAPANALEQIGRLKTVNPQFDQLMKLEDGLFRLKSGANAGHQINVKMVSGAIEGSNVNAVSEMVSLIDLQRQFEMQIQMMKIAEENDSSAEKLMRLG